MIGQFNTTLSSSVVHLVVMACLRGSSVKAILLGHGGKSYEEAEMSRLGLGQTVLGLGCSVLGIEMSAAFGQAHISE